MTNLVATYNVSDSAKALLLSRYLPNDVLIELDDAIKKHDWKDYSHPGREVLLTFPGKTQDFLNGQALNDMCKWTGVDLKLDIWHIWKDTEGLEYPKHKDRGSTHYHFQIYLMDGPEYLGTQFYANFFSRRPILSANYARNFGYVISPAQKIYHGVNKVKSGDMRLSLYARYIEKNDTWSL